MAKAPYIEEGPQAPSQSRLNLGQIPTAECSASDDSLRHRRDAGRNRSVASP